MMNPKSSGPRRTYNPQAMTSSHQPMRARSYEQRVHKQHTHASQRVATKNPPALGRWGFLLTHTGARSRVYAGAGVGRRTLVAFSPFGPSSASYSTVSPSSNVLYPSPAI